MLVLCPFGETLKAVTGLILRHCSYVNPLKPGQNGHHLADDIFKCIFVNENVWIVIKISLNFVLHGPFNIIAALDQVMAWRRSGAKLVSETMMISSPTHLCTTLTQLVNNRFPAPWLLWYSIHTEDKEVYYISSMWVLSCNRRYS